MNYRLKLVAPFCILVSSALASLFEPADSAAPFLLTDRMVNLEESAFGVSAWTPASLQLESLALAESIESFQEERAWSLGWHDAGVSLSAHAQSRSIVATAIGGGELNEIPLVRADSPVIRAEVQLLQGQLDDELKDIGSVGVKLSGASPEHAHELSGDWTQDRS